MESQVQFCPGIPFQFVPESKEQKYYRDIRVVLEGEEDFCYWLYANIQSFSL